MRNKLIMLAAAVALSASSWVSAQSIVVQKVTPLAADNDISDAIKAECSLGEKLADSVKRNTSLPVSLVDGPLDIGSGRVLQMEITDSVNMGNAFMGRQAFTKIRGTLYQDGQKVATFKARRNSMGGAFAGFKGACSVLGRTVETLGKDVGGWLQAPKDEAALGD
jgi:hypothetical protein